MLLPMFPRPNFKFLITQILVVFVLSSTGIAQNAIQLGWIHNHIKASELDPKMEHKGDFVDGVRWQDEAGEQTFFLCYDQREKEMARDIYLYQYSKVGSTVKLVWDIKDFSGALCSETFIFNSLQLVDFDQDGVLEACFIYQNQCDGLDPYTTKMMLMVNGKKLAIRGKFAVEDGAEVEQKIDPIVAQYPKLYKNFMLMVWNDFKTQELEYERTIKYKTSDVVVLEKEYLMASGGTEYELLDLDGIPLPLSKTLTEKINWASTLDLMPDRKNLLYASTKGIGIYDPVARKDQSLMTFFEDTDAISQIVWSPDRSKIAFAALNRVQYPKATKIFVLTLKGNELVKKEKFDVKTFYMAASIWVVDGPKFIDNQTLEYIEHVNHEDDPEKGPRKTISLN